MTGDPSGTFQIIIVPLSHCILNAMQHINELANLVGTFRFDSQTPVCQVVDPEELFACPPRRPRIGSTSPRRPRTARCNRSLVRCSFTLAR